jgi:hypothetical protein
VQDLDSQSRRRRQWRASARNERSVLPPREIAMTVAGLLSPEGAEVRTDSQIGWMRRSRLQKIAVP